MGKRIVQLLKPSWRMVVAANGDNRDAHVDCGIGIGMGRDGPGQCPEKHVQEIFLFSHFPIAYMQRLLAQHKPATLQIVAWSRP